MIDIVSHAAIVGRTQLMPGILPVRTRNPDGECLVAHGFPPKIVDPKRGLELDVSDCTVFTVTHKDSPPRDYRLHVEADQVFEQALQAISEVTLWTKSKDVVGRTSSFLRQVGRLDAKYFFIEPSPELLIGWRNPLFWSTRDAAAMIAGFLSNMIVQNGPASSPTPLITRRAMGALDLINLGFYTESFVSLFALLDDLTQEVIRAGMAKKGLPAAQQASLLRAIKEERLRHYLDTLAHLCDWQSLAVANPELSKRLVKANMARNNIMHGSVRLTRTQTVEFSNTLLEVVDWLRGNPFGYAIPSFPLLQLATGEFFVVQDAPPAAAETEATSEASKE